MSRGISLSVGDRDLPLEVDLETDLKQDHSLVGEPISVSPVAGGSLLSKRGELGEIDSVASRLGEVVGYQASIDGKKSQGSKKDFFVGTQVLEDIQNPTPTSVALKEGLSHWSQQRTYWHSRIDGLEALCFQLATVTPRANVRRSPGGWQFIVPDPMPGRFSVVDCKVAKHGNFWTMSVMVFPSEGSVLEPPLIENHWARVFSWAADAALLGGLSESAIRELRVRAVASSAYLEGVFTGILDKVFSETGELPPSDVYPAFSAVRLKPGFVGLTEPPSDRRPYTVVSLSPKLMVDEEYLEQVILHECIHIAVASNGGDPHGERFKQLASLLGLAEKHRD